MKMKDFILHGLFLLLTICGNGIKCKGTLYPREAFPSQPQARQLGGLGLLSEQLQARSVKRVQGALHQMGLMSNYQSPLEKIALGGSAKCNDGSQAGLYFRLSENSRRWIVFLEGGWHCFDHESCNRRWKNSRHLMSSSQWPQTRRIGGILSTDPLENPHWWKANHVYVPYCSSDCWSGTHVGSRSIFESYFKNESKIESDINIEEFNFLGSIIIDEVVKMVISLGLKTGHSLIFAGSSAGGLGVLLNLDRIKEHLQTIGIEVDVRGIADSAWFLDNEPFVRINCQNSHSCAEIQAIKSGLILWKGRIHKDCSANLGAHSWQCYLGYKLLPFTKAPLFIFQWIFDEAQMIMDNVGKPVSKEQWNYIHNTGERIKRSLSNVSAVFAPSCISHTALTSSYWSNVKIRHVSLPDALHCWSALEKERGKGLNGRSVLNNQQSNRSFLGTSKDGSNLEARLRPDNKWNDNSDLNTITTKSNRIRHGRKKKKCRKCKKGKKRPHRKSRKHKIPSSVSRESEQPCSNFSASNMLADSPNTNSKQSESQSVRNALTHTNNSSATDNLVKTETKRRRKKDKHRKKERKRRKKLRRRERKKQKRRRRKNRKNKAKSRRNSDTSERLRSMRSSRYRNGFGHKRLSSLESRISSNRKRREASLKQQSQSEYSLLWKSFGGLNGKEEPSQIEDYHEEASQNDEEQQCPLHLVDSCSWPHCNPSCPPLINPYTGEEMSRVQLLKSFGLNMGDFAQALGIDLATLKAMDNKDIVLILSP